MWNSLEEGIMKLKHKLAIAITCTTVIVSIWLLLGYCFKQRIKLIKKSSYNYLCKTTTGNKPEQPEESTPQKPKEETKPTQNNQKL